MLERRQVVLSDDDLLARLFWLLFYPHLHIMLFDTHQHLKYDGLVLFAAVVTPRDVLRDSKEAEVLRREDAISLNRAYKVIQDLHLLVEVGLLVSESPIKILHRDGMSTSERHIP